MKDDMDPFILNKWLSGEATEEDLRKWLKELYPADMHEDIMHALDGSETEESDENIDNILDSMAQSLEKPVKDITEDKNEPQKEDS